MKDFPLLSLSIWLPTVSGIVLLLFFSHKDKSSLARLFALLLSACSFLVTLPLYYAFDAQSAALQFVEFHHWLSFEFFHLPIHYHLGVDGLAVFFIILNALSTFLVILASSQITKKVPAYYGLFLLMSGLVNGVFAAADGFLFYVFFEASLVPFYLIIGIWGGKNRLYAAFKFFLYTVAGSIFFLICIAYLAHVSSSFEISAWQSVPLTFLSQTFIFFALLFAFGIKVPMWPVHTWLPDAHVEAPTGASVILAAIALKVGAYAMLRFLLPVVPDACHYFAPVVVVLSLVAIIYIAFVALAQTDMKKLVAYSSISHMGFVTLGFFMFDYLGWQGAVFQMISHAFVSAAMFFCIGVLYDRLHTREISDYSGVVNKMPYFSALALLFFMANAGLPGTSGFVGEFMVIISAVKQHFYVGVIAALSLIFGAAYTLWMYKRVYFGSANQSVSTLSALSAQEACVLVILAVCVLFSGIYPKPLTTVIDHSLSHVLDQSKISKLMVGIS